MDSFPKVVGEALRRARVARGLTLRDASARSGRRFAPSALGGYERGERSVSLARFCELARLYGVPADRLLGEALEALNPLGRSTVVIDLNRLAGGEDADLRQLAEFIHHVRAQRGDYLTSIVTLRSGDVEAVALRSGTTPRGLMRKIEGSLAEGIATD